MFSLGRNASTGVPDSWWLTVSRRLPAASLQPTAVAGQAFVGRMSAAHLAGDLPAKACLGAIVPWR